MKFLTAIVFILAATILLPGFLTANGNLCSFDSKELKKGAGCAKDMDAEIKEIRRSPQISIVQVKVKKRGTYAGSIIFQVCSFSKIAKQRGYRYYAILHRAKIEGCKECEWEEEYTLGFMNSKTESIIEKFRNQYHMNGDEFKIEDINESSMSCGFMPIPAEAFGLAVYRGDIIEIKKLIAESKGYLKQKDDFGFMPLHIATAEGQAEIVRYLISSGVEIDAKGMYGYSPLHMAVLYNRADIVKILLAHHADPNFKMDWGNTPLHTAAYSGLIEIADMIISAGGKVNETDYEGNTPFHAAASRGNLAMLKFLLSKGADPEKQNARGQTAIAIAKIMEQREIINFLDQLEDKN